MVTLRFSLSLALALIASSVGAQQVELLDFYTPGCGPCREMEPVVAQLEAEGVRVHRVDGSREVGLASQLGVDRYPTFVVVADGREVGRRVGATSYEDLRGMLTAARPVQAAPARSTFATPPPAPQKFAAAEAAFGGAERTPADSAAPTPDGDRLIASSVRLTVDEGGAVSYGTGTIVDARSGEALVVTCAHLFFDEHKRPIDVTGKLTLELFESTAGVARVVERVEGQLISHDAEADVALVAIRPRAAVRAAAIARSPGDLRIGDSVRSVGCDLGADPTGREHRVVDLNRYLGPPNVEASGAPVQGRSGGGLFNAAGELIGVCNFADESADEGIYAGLASIHQQLDRVGLSELYRGGPAAAPADAFAAAPAPTTPPAADLPRNDLTPIPRTPVLRGQSPAPKGEPLLTSSEQAALDEIGRRAEGGDVTIVIHTETGGREVLTLDAASPEFLAALRRLSNPR